MTIWFDMDGTIANLYAVENWLPKLRNEDTSPYADAVPLLKMNVLARLLNRAQRNGYKIGIVSWTSKGGSAEYNKAVAITKIKWLANHLASVRFDEIRIMDYGTPKSTVMSDSNDILFDDEEPNRREWKGVAHDVNNIIGVLKGLNAVA